MDLLPVPPADFCRRLALFDPYLQLNFHKDMGCWQIFYRDKWTNEVNHVMNVINNDGSFRELDERTFDILRRNRYYAEHPDELIEKVVNSIEDGKARDRKNSADEVRNITKDRALRRKFKEVRELARSISWQDWLKPQGEKYIDDKGRVRHTYEPDKSLIADPRKPTI